jgi:hypothetical protein
MIVKTRTSVKYQGEWYGANETLEIKDSEFNPIAFTKIEQPKTPKEPKNVTPEQDKEESVEDKIDKMKRQDIMAALKERNVEYAVIETNEDLKKKLLENW